VRELPIAHPISSSDGERRDPSEFAPPVTTLTRRPLDRFNSD
jgi:hypothetical protein